MNRASDGMAPLMAFTFQIASLPARLGLAVTSGVVYALAFPPLGWRWLIIPGIAGLLLSLEGARGARARGLGFLHGMAAFATGLPWLWLLFGPFAIILWAILAIFTAAFAWMQSRAQERGVKGTWLTLLTVVNWCGWEFIRAELFPLRFPWMTAGLAWGPNSLLPWVGVYAAGAVIVLLAVCLVQRRWIALAVLTIPFLSASIPYVKWNVPQGRPHDIFVAGVQLEGVSFDRYLKTTRELPLRVQHRDIDGTAFPLHHVVWPEYAVPFDIRASPRELNVLIDLCRERNITLTIGTQTRPPARPVWFNTALTLDGTGVLGEHHKTHPVHLFNDGTAGATALPIKTAQGVIGTPICFDCDYEGVVRRMAAAGAEAFIVPMMDAEGWSKMQHDQHAELFRIRACENGRWFFVCGTSGVSQAIDSRGAVHAKMEALQQGVLTSFVRRETSLTFYTRSGWLAPWCLLAVAGVWWIVLLLPHRAAKDSAS